MDGILDESQACQCNEGWRGKYCQANITNHIHHILVENLAEQVCKTKTGGVTRW